MINTVQSWLKEQETTRQMEQSFKTTSLDEFLSWGAKCESNFDRDTLDGFYRGYMGAGQKSFEFNKCLRFGFDKYYSMFPQFINDPFLNKEAVENRVKKLDKLTRGFKLPRDCRGFRYVDENYIISQFKGYLKNYENLIRLDRYGYETIPRDKITIDELHNALSKSIGQRIRQDNGFTSFSLVEKNTHMGKKNNPDEYKRILLRYDCEEGTECYVSQYVRESECMFPRNTHFFVKDVTKEVGDDGNERVVILYGIAGQQ